jgi:hypothetical protein
MPEMQHNFESKAAKRLVEAYYHKSKTEGVFSQKYDWDGVATIRLRSLPTVPLNQYDWQKTNGSRFGALTEQGDKVQPLTMTQDYAYNIAIDKRNNTSTLMEKAAGTIAKNQINRELIPQTDKYRLAAISTGNGVTGFGTEGVGGIIKTGVTLTKTNVVETIMTHNAEMNNFAVTEDRVLFIKETEVIKLKLADQILGAGATVQDVANRIIKSGEMGVIDGLHIVKIPDSYMPTGVLYMIVAKDAVVAPTKIRTMRILTTHPDVDGAVAQGRFFYDCFVIEEHANGVLVAKSTT